ncbi:hypothetical protein FB451DRAFT_1173157 [Mycena latifolia]|nr:hypothetical protein FB451DRAFT_1173157 [Mycena latifolia]
MASTGGRPPNKLLENHFKRGDKLPNKSGRYKWDYDYCDAGKNIEGRDLRPAIHLKDCSAAPAEARQAAHRHLMAKGSITASTGLILPDVIAPDTPMPDTAVESQAQGERREFPKQKAVLPP